MSKLTDTKIKNIKEKGKHFDGGGLYLNLLNTGGKSWRIDYRFEGKYKTLTLGLYPTITLAMARKSLLEVKEKLKAGIDPTVEKKALEQAIKDDEACIFETIALDWIAKKLNDKTEKHRQDVLSKLERFIYPTFRNRNIKSISSREMLDCIRKMEARGIHETTKKTLGICNQIYSFAIGEGLAEINICNGLRGQLMSVKPKNYAHIENAEDFGVLLKKIDNYPHGILIKTALQLAPLIFLRPSELVQATWTEINFDTALWTIPEERMKLRKKHLVPLSSQVLELLKYLHSITGDTDFLFANWNKRNKPISADGVRQGLRRLGYEDLTTHGFRHTASTMLNELGYNRDHIEKQLAHSTRNTVRGTYNHAEYLLERKKMLQEWADYLDTLKFENK